jgi:TM2 domain
LSKKRSIKIPKLTATFHRKAYRAYIRSRIGGKEMDELQASREKKMTMVLLCHFLGWFGVHRFYTGKTISGILMLLTLGGGGIWVLIGVCIHDYAIDPCPYHLNCLRGCSEYLRTKGDKEEQKNVAEVYNFHLIQLQRSKKAEEEGASMAGNFAAYCARIVEGAKAALAVDGIEASDGELVKVFPDGKLLGTAITDA